MSIRQVETQNGQLNRGLKLKVENKFGSRSKAIQFHDFTRRLFIDGGEKMTRIYGLH